jgi:hypothetical protein
VTGGERGLHRSMSGRQPAPLLSQPLVRVLLILLLLALVAVEEYSILSLREKIARQGEELRNISFQLQTLKNERAALGEELSSMKKLAGDKNDGTTAEGKN